MLESFLLYLFLLVMFWFSCWLFFSGIIGVIRMLRSRNWETVRGEIISGDIYFKTFNGDHSGDTRHRFVKVIEYSYSIKGKEYSNNQTFASDSLYISDYKPISKLSEKKRLLLEGDSSFAEAKEKINKSIGKPILIYYDPNKPSRACLNNTFNKGIFLPIGMGLFFGFLITLFFAKLMGY